MKYSSEILKCSITAVQKSCNDVHIVCMEVITGDIGGEKNPRAVGAQRGGRV